MKTKANTAGWTDERIEQLRKLWGSGLSAAQIAMALGGVNRNGVIGKAYRLGLLRHHQKTIGSRISPYKPHKTRNSRPVVFESTAYGVAFMDLERRHCRWPVDAQFCGADAVESKPYCGRHLRMAYR